MTVGKMLPLIEAMRSVVRARYPARPALADEVQSLDWFRPPLDGSVRPVEERQAVDEAFETLRAAIISQDVRLHGRLNGGTGADINPTEIDQRGIDVLKNELQVYQGKGLACSARKTTGFQHLHTYSNVHCYAADIDALIGPAVPAPSPIEENRSRDKRDRAGEAIAAVWHGNIPARSVLPNSKFCGMVREWLKADCRRRGVEYVELSNETILRNELVPPDRRRKEK